MVITKRQEEILIQRGAVICFKVTGLLMIHTLFIIPQNVPLFSRNLIAKRMVVLINSMSSTDGNLKTATYQGTCPLIYFLSLCSFS